jgi:Helix-turn-helix domain
MPDALSPLFGWRGAIASSDLPAPARHVALTLSLHMNERGGSAFPSVGTLAGETGLNERTVQRHLVNLVEAGWLIVEERHRENGSQTSNDYTAAVPPGGVAEDHQGGGTESPPPVAQSHPQEEGVSKRASVRARRSPETPFPCGAFVITAEMHVWLTENNLGHIDWKRETGKFKDWALANDRRYRDWVAAWRNWMRKAGEFQPPPVRDFFGNKVVQ